MVCSPADATVYAYLPFKQDVPGRTHIANSLTLDSSPTDLFIFCKYLFNVQSTKKNAEISDTCSFGRKINLTVLFRVFYVNGNSFLHANRKVVRCGTLHNERHL